VLLLLPGQIRRPAPLKKGKDLDKDDEKQDGDGE